MTPYSCSLYSSAGEYLSTKIEEEEDDNDNNDEDDQHTIHHRNNRIHSLSEDHHQDLPLAPRTRRLTVQGPPPPVNPYRERKVSVRPNQRSLMCPNIVEK